jgi:small subunit ribosomal protein S2
VQQPVTSTFGQTPQATLRSLLEAGVHFGHQAKRWNPKMKPYIFTERNGIHIIDLQQTVPMLRDAHQFVSELTANGGRILFVGTKKQAQEVVEREAARSNQFYVNRRWLGGTLTNFVTIRNRLRYMKQLQGQRDRGEFDYLPKQEAAGKLTELERLERTLGGMRDMTQLPGAIFVVDPKREHLAIHEARRLKIPIIAITDTNCDPDDVDFLIPGNDDAIRSVRLLTAGIADAALDGQMQLDIARAEAAMDRGEEAEAAVDSAYADEDAAAMFAQAAPTEAAAAPVAAPAPAEPAETAAPEASAAEAPVQAVPARAEAPAKA